MRNGNVKMREYGFTYLGLLIAVALLSATLASAGTVWHTAQQRERERDLLFVGDHIRQAIGRYYNAGTPKQYPEELDDLLRDPRQPGVVRYLRKLYYDPMSNSTEWGLIKTEDHRVAGVFSRSEEHPIKQANFSTVDQDFNGKEKYSEWLFIYQPTRTSAHNKTAITTSTIDSGTDP